jgi:alanine racemase
VLARDVREVGGVWPVKALPALRPGAAALGDVVTIFGGKVTLADHAEQMGTNVYEALTAIGPRVPRIHR